VVRFYLLPELDKNVKLIYITRKLSLTLFSRRGTIECHHEVCGLIVADKKPF
jgi:hypothetical protein